MGSTANGDVRRVTPNRVLGLSAHATVELNASRGVREGSSWRDTDWIWIWIREGREICNMGNSYK